MTALGPKQQFNHPPQVPIRSLPAIARTRMVLIHQAQGHIRIPASLQKTVSFL